MKRLLILSAILFFALSSFAQTISCGNFEYEIKSKDGENIAMFVRGPFGGAAILPRSNIFDMIDITVTGEAHVGGAHDGSALPDGRDEEIWYFRITGDNPSFSPKRCDQTLSFKSESKIVCGESEMELISLTGDNAEVKVRIKNGGAYITPTSYILGTFEARLGGSGNPNHYGLCGGRVPRGDWDESMWPITKTGNNAYIFYKACPDKKLYIK
ncbi:MAG: hypothetical protein R8P61_30910 [Bacteroidia bacterium]|nr:hypothetical protein [Bacteroidia bacterium]